LNKIEQTIYELDTMKSYPRELYYDGNTELLNRRKVSIVGSRKTSKYSREMTHKLSSALAKVGVCVVSGGAMGVDAVAHLGAGASNTIAVLPCGINIKYPAVNKNLLRDIQTEGLLLSQFKKDEKARPWSFVVRNELVVALGEVLIVAEAELNSGSMRSIEYALAMGKEIFVFPHRLGESSATNQLLKEGKAKAIYDIDAFVLRFGSVGASRSEEDAFTIFCQANPTYEETLLKFPSRVFEAELNAEIEVINGKIFLL